MSLGARQKKLNKFWRASNFEVKWKVTVYNAVIGAQITYGLHTNQLTNAQRTKIDAFQIRGLRAILKIDHSVRSRVSNEEVIHRANVEAKKIPHNMTLRDFNNKKNKLNKTIKPFTEILDQRKASTLGHVMRIGALYGNNEDPEYSATFDVDGKRQQRDKKRVGRPRTRWITTAMAKAFEKTQHMEFEEDNEDHLIILYSDCINKLF